MSSSETISQVEPALDFGECLSGVFYSPWEREKYLSRVRKSLLR